MHEFMSDEISPKMGGVDYHIVVEPQHMSRCVLKKLWGFWKTVVNLCHSRKNGNIHDVGFCEYLDVMKTVGKASGDIGKLDKKGGNSAEIIIEDQKDDSLHLTSYERWRVAHCPSVLSFATSIGCAKMASLMGNGGVFRGQ